MRASNVHEPTTTTFSCIIFVKFRYLDIYPELSHESVTAVEAGAQHRVAWCLVARLC